jgi:N-acetylglucosaminyldiphosphoundecaprenol N-acetyl-beta-D-mannosaminyltransferase
VERAPRWARRLGVEWTYRLSREPLRLYRRYLLGNPAFLLKLVAWRWRGESPRG